MINFNKKTISAAISVLALSLTTAASPSWAANILGEVRLGDVREGKQKSTEYKMEYNDNFGVVTYGGELQVRQNSEEGALGSRVSLRSGMQTPDVLGLKTAVFGELGTGLSVNNNDYFWGAAASVSRAVYGPVSITAGARRRQNFKDPKTFTENRFNVGMRYAATQNLVLGVQYYMYSGDTSSVALSHAGAKIFSTSVLDRNEIGLQVIKSF